MPIMPICCLIFRRCWKCFVDSNPTVQVKTELGHLCHIQSQIAFERTPLLKSNHLVTAYGSCSSHLKGKICFLSLVLSRWCRSIGKSGNRSTWLVGPNLGGCCNPKPSWKWHRRGPHEREINLIVLFDLREKNRQKMRKILWKGWSNLGFDIQKLTTLHCQQ